jgi:hypothetical protein
MTDQQSMTAHVHHQPSQRALATRSLTAAMRLPLNSPERAEAMRRHFERFVPHVSRPACSVRP